MGDKFDITVVADNEEIGYINIEEAVSEIKRIEKMISSWDEESETSLINKNAGIKPVKVSVELYKLIERANQISEITNGAFDITFAGMDNIWKFDGSMKFKPTKDEIIHSVSKVGYKKIILNEVDHTVFLRLKGMKIGFGGIAKGYAADMAKELLVGKQVRAGVINASGDLTTWGTKATGEKWLIGIANPLSKDKIFSWLPVLESSVATSESYDKYITFDGRKYSHILDPRTGNPISGINSVSVFSKTAEFSDALATAIFVLGVDSGMSLINQLKGTEAIIVDGNNKMHKSSGILFN
ncbi:FAD:protein FMN transferase [Arenibacter sp. M-2]|uniref:FAD:protein FMN transferase n=1 Tax=unclassified Arenibacter TaxID=2615047 RepID=UPI000D7511A7|nr:MULTISPECIES: FAD:protein FMN transferase [unclassified Arenibacter]MDL5511597.1 FAD:protein FMN transferase [Arenibacter sp. M-2]|tara:strand:- start:10323 stop:11213 length:891 start_codon:yes stop_codon:yes gene_type:complete